MTDEKDRLGDTLAKKEKAEEDLYFKQKEAEALAKLRQAGRSANEDEIRELARDRCPRCGERLASMKLHGVAVEECPAGHGSWLEKGEIEVLATRERDSWLGRYFFRPKPVV